jgi:autotransporter-associated beta strand protein
MTGTAVGTTLSIQGDQNVTNTFGGVISGAGRVLFEAANFGPGPTTMILTGDNTYTGGTEICDCTTLQLGDGHTTGSIVGDVALGGTLIFNRSDRYTFAGAISDDGPEQGKLAQNGSGTVVLAGANSYSGGTTVNAGILELAHATTGVIDAAGFGTVTLKGGELRTNVTGTSEFANGLTFRGGTALNPLTSIFAAASGTTVNLTAAADAVTYANRAVAQFGTATDNGTIVYQTAGFDNFNGSFSVVVGGGTLMGPAPGDPADVNTYNFSLATMLGTASNVAVNTAATLDLTN